MLSVLIGCECSGALRSRFLAAGFDVYSCDFKPAEDCVTDRHLQRDVFHCLTSPQSICGKPKWDLFICFPDCTALTVAGNHVYAAGKQKHKERLKAVQWTNELWCTAKQYADRIAFENPQGVLSTLGVMGKATQYIQPYDFGDDASKKTGLWLHELPKLIPTNRLDGRMVEWPPGSGKLVERWGNQCDSGQNKLGPSAERATERARTYPGIADAMVSRWGNTLRKQQEQQQ